jgi:hypothetical protein
VRRIVVVLTLACISALVWAAPATAQFATPGSPSSTTPGSPSIQPGTSFPVFPSFGSSFPSGAVIAPSADQQQQQQSETVSVPSSPASASTPTAPAAPAAAATGRVAFTGASTSRQIGVALLALLLGTLLVRISRQRRLWALSFEHADPPLRLTDADHPWRLLGWSPPFDPHRVL